MKTIIILVCFPSFLYSQNKSTDNLYRKNGEPERLTFYNAESHTWTITEYNSNGTVGRVFYYDSTGFYFKGQNTRFDENGKIAYTINFIAGDLYGKVFQFYANGNLRTTGECYNNYRVGQWNEYYPNGQLKSVKNYIISKTDSTNKDFTSPTIKSRIEYLTLMFGETDIDYLNELASNNLDFNLDDSYSLGSKDVYFCLNGLKSGIWTYYNINGELIKKENY